MTCPRLAVDLAGVESGFKSRASGTDICVLIYTTLPLRLSVVACFPPKVEFQISNEYFLSTGMSHAVFGTTILLLPRCQRNLHLLFAGVGCGYEPLISMHELVPLTHLLMCPSWLDNSLTVLSAEPRVSQTDSALPLVPVMLQMLRASASLVSSPPGDKHASIHMNSTNFMDCFKTI